MIPHAIANLRRPGIDRPRGVPFAKSPTRHSESPAPIGVLAERKERQRPNGRHGDMSARGKR